MFFDPYMAQRMAEERIKDALNTGSRSVCSSIK